MTAVDHRECNVGYTRTIQEWGKQLQARKLDLVRVAAMWSGNFTRHQYYLSTTLQRSSQR